MRNTLTLILSSILLSALFGVTAVEANYDLNSNVLEIVFDDNVRTDEVLLGLIEFSDGVNTIVVDGGIIETMDLLSNSVQINLIYGTVLDERANNDEDTSNLLSDFMYWGNSNALANDIEAMDVGNLTLNLEQGAFVSEDLTGNMQTQDLPVSLINNVFDLNSPVPESAVYDANVNKLTITFDRVVQFDQLPEDRTCNNGQDVCPGNGSLDGGPPEDGEDVQNDEVFGNNNGVLDMEANIDVFKILLSSASGSMSLEGFDYIEQTADSDVIDIFLTRANAKKFELDVFGDDLAISINQGGFVDTYYNPNQSIQIPLDFIPDSQTLELISANYSMEDNELQLDFEDSRNVRYSKPYPVFSKIYVSAGVDTVVFSGIRLSNLSSSGTVLKFKELLLPDQAALELLIRDAQASGTPVFVNIDEYAVYDVENNGNLAAYGIPLTIAEEYTNPDIFPGVDEISYSARYNQIQIDWSPEPEDWTFSDGVSQYFDYKLVQDRYYQEMVGVVVNDLTTGEVFVPEYAFLSRDGNKEFTYITLDNEDAGWFETVANADHVLELSVAPYTFFSAGNSDNNGNHQITETIVYLDDEAGPVISSARLDIVNQQLILAFDKNVKTSSFDPGSLDISVNGMAVSVTDYSIDLGEGFIETAVLQFTDASFNELIGYLPEGEVLDIQMDLKSDIAFNLDNTGTLPFLDTNDNGILDHEPYSDFGSDGISSDMEPGYPGACSEDGMCSDPQYTNQMDCESAGGCVEAEYLTEDDCLDHVGSCTNPRKHDREACEDAGATWTPDPGAWSSESWTEFESQSDCENNGAVWTPNLDPSGDDYDAVENPTGTEGNMSYDPGEPFEDWNGDEIWNPIAEPTTIEIAVGRFLWNESHRAFADTPEYHFFIQKFVNDDIKILIDQAVWEGQCYDEERERAADCTAPNVTYINGRCVYVGVHTDAECDAVAGAGETPIFTQVSEEDVLNLAVFYSSNKSQLESVHSELDDIDDDGRLTLALYDISDEYGKGANDTNSSLFTHGYYTLYEEPADMINVGDFLYLDVSPQVIAGDDDELNTLYNAMVHEFTKMLIDQNDPDEEAWLKEGFGLFEQKRILDNVAFFGRTTSPGVASGNQLTYISFSKRDRADQHNIYLFLSYLLEKYIPTTVENMTGWDLLDAVAFNDSVMGIAAIDTALYYGGYPEVTSADVFIDYAVTCFLDVEHALNYYDGKYTIDAVDIHAPPTSKNAGSLKFTGDNLPPYSLAQVPPWSFNFYFMEGLSVSLIDNSITEKTPLLDPYDELIIDGFDGVALQGAKIMLKNGFTEMMDANYEVAYFDIDSETSRGSLPVTTNSITIADETLDYEFKSFDGVCSDGSSPTQIDCCENNGGLWVGGACAGGTGEWTWFGNQNMALVVAKVDDAQPANTYDFIVTNVAEPADYSNFYVMQNTGFRSFLDLYVVSERPIFDAFGVEGPNIEVVGMVGTNGVDTTHTLLEPTNFSSDEYILYHSPLELGTWENYQLTYSGMDQNGLALPEIDYIVTTLYTLGRQGTYFSTENSGILIPDFGQNVRLVAYDVPGTGQGMLPELNRSGLTGNSEMTYFSAVDGDLPVSTTIRVKLENPSDTHSQLYRLNGDTWVNLGGEIEDEYITAVTDQFGYFVVLSGTNHLPVTDVELVPGEFILTPNYPNPFNAQTTLRYYLPEESLVQMEIYNIRGQFVTSLVNEVQTANWYSLNWNGHDAAGVTVPSGVYFVRINTGNVSETQKMVLLK